MLGVTGEPKYADVVERVFYNAMLSGWGLDGKTYFYTNPLRRFGKELPLLHNDSWERWPSTMTPGAPYCYCCPPNVLRTVAASAAWAYSVSEKNVWINLYGSSVFEAPVPAAGKLRLVTETDYPWDGHIRVVVESPGEFTVNFRVPGWAEGAQVRVNGRPGPAAPAGRYASVSRPWKSGDTIELVLPMEPRLIEANPRVEELRNQVAVMRGPVVYCLESPDLPPGVRLSEVALPAGVKFVARYDPELLGGVTVLEGEAVRIPEGEWEGLLYRPLRRPAAERVRIRLIPYYAWANRGVSYMTVWLPLAP